MHAALKAGASGFLLKDVQPEIVVAGIRGVHAGESLLAPTVTRRMIESFLERGLGVAYADSVVGRRLSSLTAREREVFALVARGLTNARIAGVVRFRDDGEDPRRADAHETRAARRRAGGDLRLRGRSRLPPPNIAAQVRARRCAI